MACGSRFFRRRTSSGSLSDIAAATANRKISIKSGASCAHSFIRQRGAERIGEGTVALCRRRLVRRDLHGQNRLNCSRREANEKKWPPKNIDSGPDLG